MLSLLHLMSHITYDIKEKEKERSQLSKRSEMAFSMRLVRNFSRNYATAAAGGHHSSEQTMYLWKRLSLFVGLPAISLAMFNCYLNHQAHGHDEHPEFVKYDHLRIRTKPFPWGDGNHSLFHNPKTNPLPDGYEE